ncbi:hypothetical protein [Enterovibrio norvegicus]|uniref:hypothetical protein n=1 Tax=Enterovibrio norvegicus TaxID=188144 RepID=UPI000C83D7E0|nr:hypothetical protein [Enterovibrio norvegicus]PMH64467.1 hypothetical protein BCU62_15545 [Enterovibrio norvegicus]
MIFLKRFLFVIATGILLYFMGAILIFGFGWIVWFLGSEQLMSINISENEVWKISRITYASVMIPQTLMGLYILLPLGTQDNFKEAAVATGYSMLLATDGLAKAALVGIGVYFFIEAISL